MARIIGGSPLGEVRGKVGGLVYSANRAGQYIRAYRIPVNPRTLAQDRARSAFGTASGTYHHLSGSEKSSWQAFASGVYSPKIGINVGQFSGFNAYTSLRAIVENCNAMNQVCTGKMNGSALSVPATFSDFLFTDTPPVYTVQPAIAETATGRALSVLLSAADCDEEGKFHVTYAIDGSPTGGSNIEDFVDGQGKSLGFLIQISNPNPQPGMFYQNPYKYTLGATGIPSFAIADRTAVENIEFISSTGIDRSDYQAFPFEDQYVKLSSFVVGKDGTIICNGSEEVKVKKTL